MLEHGPSNRLVVGEQNFHSALRDCKDMRVTKASSMDLTAARSRPLMLGFRFPEGGKATAHCANREFLGKVRVDRGWWSTGLGASLGLRAPFVPRLTPVLDHPPLLRLGVAALATAQRGALTSAPFARSPRECPALGRGLRAFARGVHQGGASAERGRHLPA